MNNIIQNALSGMDEEQAREILDSLDEEQIAGAIEWSVEEMVVPHLDDVRERAANDTSPEQVRKFYESKSPQEQEEIFYEVLHELMTTILLCRERPGEGFPQLKEKLRDPFTMEGLLLIFDGEDPQTGELRIDPEYTETLKDFAATHVKWVAATVIPEMYSEDEVREVLEQFDMDTQNGNGQQMG